MATQGVRGFFFNYFTRVDWGVLLAGVTLFFAGVWYIVDLKIEAASAKVVGEIAQSRADLAILKSEVAVGRDGLTKRLDEVSVALTVAFKAHSEAVDATFERGMQQRTDELSRVLVSQFESERTLTVSVANVPRNDQQTMQLINRYFEEHGARTSTYAFADKVMIRSQLQDVKGVAAQELQRIIEELWAKHPDIKTNLTWDKGDLGNFKPISPPVIPNN